MNPDPAHRLPRAVAGMAVVAAVLVVLHGMDQAPFAVPPLLDLGALGDWVVTAGPVGAVMGTARLGAMCMAWYLLVASTALVVARHTARRGPAVVAAVLLGPAARDLVVVVVGTGVLVAAPTVRLGAGLHPTAVAAAAERLDRATTTAGDVGTAVDAGPPARSGVERRGAPRMVRLPDEWPRDAAEPPHLHRLDDGRGPSEADDARTDGPGPRDTEPDRSEPDRDRPGTPPVTDEPDRRTTWTVAPGDHFWRVAEHHLHASWGSPPDDDRVRDHWRRLIAANRDILVDPGNPDLLLPGQVLRLPEPAAPPETA